MHIITKDGKIIEGQPLNSEELEILTELTDGGTLNAAADCYIASRTAQLIAKYLVENFYIKRRQPLEPEPKPHRFKRLHHNQEHKQSTTTPQPELPPASQQFTTASPQPAPICDVCKLPYSPSTVDPAYAWEHECPTESAKPNPTAQDKPAAV